MKTESLSTAELRARVLRDPVHLLAFGFGSGLSPRAPGTAGSLVGVLLAFALVPAAMPIRIAVAVVMIVAGIWICGASARRIGVHDHPGIVWDEIAAMYAVLLVVPFNGVAWCLGFVLFRLFDIWKPWPIRDLDHRMGGGLGIMLDDIAAALYASISLMLLPGIGGWIS